jgi:hypothetical protein
VGQLGFYFSSRLYKEASRLGFREAENYVEHCVPHVYSIPPGLSYWDGISDIRLVIHHNVFCVKVLVIQVLSCFCVRLAVHHRVARWIHLFSVRFIYINELLARLTFPHLQITCIAHVIGRFIRSIGLGGASWKLGPNSLHQYVGKQKKQNLWLLKRTELRKVKEHQRIMKILVWRPYSSVWCIGMEQMKKNTGNFP